jgi:hypothetical protein
MKTIRFIFKSIMPTELDRICRDFNNGVDSGFSSFDYITRPHAERVMGVGTWDTTIDVKEVDGGRDAEKEFPFACVDSMMQEAVGDHPHQKQEI